MTQFIRAYPPSIPSPGPVRWFVFQGANLLLHENGSSPSVPLGEAELFAPLVLETVLHLGELEGVGCMAATLDETSALPAGFVAVGLRALWGQVPHEQYAIAGYASQLLYWQRASRFCGFDGSPMEPIPNEWGKRCTRCGHTTYPHVSPCVIVLIHDNENILLTHKPGWGPMHSIVAGFVEPGESLEECLVREVREEVGAEVDELRYFHSQPWPFPHQLMVGFFARYVGGEIRPDPSELDVARWFHVDELPVIPAPLSIARQMIDAWIASVRPDTR